MSDLLDRLLEAPLLEPPDDFGRRLMNAIETLPPSASRRSRLREWLEWLALAAATLAGFGQLAGFLFGFWIPAAAG